MIWSTYFVMLGNVEKISKINLKVILEFPVNLININDEDPEFQICTGPIVLPDLKTWDGLELHQCFVADAAI